MEQELYSYRKLRVYDQAKGLVKEVYCILKDYPVEEKFALCDQLRRAVISVPSNIAEGAGRISDKERAHFYEIAYGSLMEVQCQMEISLELGYINQEQLIHVTNTIDGIARMLVGLRKKTISHD